MRTYKQKNSNMKLIRKYRLLQIFTLLLLFCASSHSKSYRKFVFGSSIVLPNYFRLGTSTSAYQTEGATYDSGKSQGYMEWVMSRSNISAGITSDSYHKYKEDAQVLNASGLQLYRFSMSWPRLLPTGGSDNVNKEGVKYYHAVLDELEKIGVEPMVMLHHFDHPFILEQSGGWLNETTVLVFVEYARFIFEEFGNRVKYFLTFNEPNVFCNGIYSNNWEGNDFNESERMIRTYTCGENVLKAHATIYHMYHNYFNFENNGKISISIECENYIAKYKHDHLSADVAFEFGCGWIAHPIFSKSGDYPKLMKKWVRKNNRRNQSKLPILSKKWIKKIRGSADYFALSHYSSHLVEPVPRNVTQPVNIFLPADARIILSNDPNWTRATNGLYVVPSGMRSILRKIKTKYHNPIVYVMENGYANEGRLNDTDRIKFIYSYVKNIMDAIKYDHCKVRAYLYWSLIDGFEFNDRFSAHFGLAHVDFEDPNRPRTMKQSVIWLRKVVKSRILSINL